MNQRLRLAGMAALMSVACVASPLAMAAPSAAPADAEEQIDEGLKGFGYVAGLALGCVAKEQRKAMEREVMDLNAEISRLLGIDRAFLFTAGFGHGTSVELTIEDCKTVLGRYEGRVMKFRQGKGGK